MRVKTNLLSITLIVPAYNSELYLLETLESLALQSFTDFEVIVVDDGSTDGTLKIAEEFSLKDSRFKTLQNKSNLGESAALNLGWKSAKGSFIGFVSSDDPQKLDWLEKMKFQIDLFPGFTHYYPDRIVIDESGELVSVDSLYDWNRDVLIGKMICIASAGTIINKQPLPTSFLPRNENLVQCSDLSQMLELSKFGSGKRIKHVYGVWRQHSNNLSKSKKINNKIAEFEDLTSNFLVENLIYEESPRLYVQAKIYVLFQKLLWTKEQLGVRHGFTQIRSNHNLYLAPFFDLAVSNNLTFTASIIVKVLLKCLFSWFCKIPKKFTSHLKQQRQFQVS